MEFKNLIQVFNNRSLGFVLAAALLASSANAFAGIKSIVVGNEIASSADVIEKADKYLVQIARPNAEGISVNRFSDLTSSGKEVVLMNTLWGNPKLRDQPAEKIVLFVESSSPAAFKKLKVEGRSSDIILLSPNGIDCNGCQVQNTERVTFAAGTSDLNSARLETITASEGGTISITGNGFESKQSSIVDFVASNVVIDGPLVTNIRGRITQDGQKQVKEIDPSGSLEVANGDVQVIVGKLSFRYSDRQSDAEFSSFNGNAIHMTKNASVKVGNLHLESSHENGNVLLNGVVSAKGVWSYVGRYKNQSVVPMESVFIKSNGNVTLVDKILATNKVEIDSTNSVFVTPPGGILEYATENIWGSEVSIVALQQFENTGAITAENAHVKAKTIINEGDIEASKEIYLDGSSYIKNQFGGVILSELIHLKSDLTVTNGSLYPFRLVSSGTTSNANARSATVDSIEVGAKHAVPPPPSGMIQRPVNSLSAYILGQNVKVEANEFINVNPYEVTKEAGIVGYCSFSDPPKCHYDANITSLSLDYLKSTQVITSAELTLDLRLKQRFWNISAIAESWTGNTIIQAPQITNERYSIWADNFKRTQTVSSGNTTTQHEIYVQYVRSVSPTSKILVGDKALMKSHAFHNKHSAFEVKGDLISDIPNVYHEGLNLREIWDTTTTTEHSRRYCTRKILGKCIKRSTHWWTTTSIPEITKDDVTASFPFVFYVDGHIHKGFGFASIVTDVVTFGPGGTYTPPEPPKPTKPSRFIPIINSGITIFIPNPNYAEQLAAYLGAQ